MIYLKGSLVGTLAVLAATVLYIVVKVLLLRGEIAHQLGPGFHGEVSLDLRAVLMSDPVYWFVALTAFVAGFFWAAHKG
ncbi:MAG TPA: hypothetical protein VE422_10740 [Terriglobia bacterium]|nr:hypothetical protein [Terriglobia bacterium]